MAQIKSKKAKEYLASLAPEIQGENSIEIIIATTAVIKAEKELLEAHAKELQELKDKAIEAFKSYCAGWQRNPCSYYSLGCHICEKCYIVERFTKKLNEHPKTQLAMKPNELRIGNWILPDKTNIPMRVVNLGADYLYLDFEGNEGDVWEPDMKRIYGIPLSEDILVKLGFEKIYSHEDQAHEDYHEWHEKIYPTLGCVYQGDGDYVFCEKFDDRKIYFLHELQNLYHAITGEELNVEL